MTTSFSQIVIIFVLYSFLGWLCETVWCGIGNKKLVNRGFLFGPWCPVYGFGGLLILLCTMPLADYPPLVFLVSVIATSALEYFTGWLLETLFQTRWWDYSSHRINIKGRVCLRNSLMFGLLGLGVIYLVHPPIWRLINEITPQTQRWLAGVIIVILGTDLGFSLASVTGLRERMKSLKEIFAELEEYQEEHTWFDKRDLSGSVARLRVICEGDHAGGHAREILAQIDKLKVRKGSGLRILRAFPRMQAKGFSDELNILRREWELKRPKGKSGLREQKSCPVCGKPFRAARRKAYCSAKCRRQGQKQVKKGRKG